MNEDLVWMKPSPVSIKNMELSKCYDVLKFIRRKDLELQAKFNKDVIYWYKFTNREWIEALNLRISKLESEKREDKKRFVEEQYKQTIKSEEEKKIKSKEKQSKLDKIAEFIGENIFNSNEKNRKNGFKCAINLFKFIREKQQDYELQTLLNPPIWREDILKEIGDSKFERVRDKQLTQTA